MKVIWTPRAAADLENAVGYISKDKPDAAANFAARTYKRIEELALTPHIGRPGAVRGTLELVFHPWQYIAVYKVKADVIRILKIRHSSQQYL